MTATDFKPAAEERPDLTIPTQEPDPVLIIVMGPASCGKSTVGTDLASALSLPFIDGDSLHPASNIQKMTGGIPLTDDDRLPWLALIRSTAERKCKEEWEKHQGDFTQFEAHGIGRAGIVIACSALRKWYRDILRGEIEARPPPEHDLPPSHSVANAEHKVSLPATTALRTYFVYCEGSPELLAQRIAQRKSHFMGSSMLASQLATLEDPNGEKGVVSVDISLSQEEVAKQAVQKVRALFGYK